MCYSKAVASELGQQYGWEHVRSTAGQRVASCAKEKPDIGRGKVEELEAIAVGKS